MSEIKWIKIVTDVFDNEKIKFIEALPDGDTIIVIWFKLLCLAGKSNDCGAFMLTENIPYTDDMLVSYLGRKETTVKFAMQTFEQLGMIERYDSTTLIANWIKYQNVKGIEEIKEHNRQRKANQRARQKGLPEPYPKCDSEEESDEEDMSRDSHVTVTQKCSYSNSISKSEKCYQVSYNNYNNIIDNYVFSDEMKNKILDWLKYKAESKREDYTEQGLKSLLTTTTKQISEHGEQAVIDCIDVCIGNRYAGIIWDKIKPNAKPVKTFVEY